MNLVFVNSMEKLAGDQMLSGQISICEQHGRWQVTWNEQDLSGKTLQEDWYEGTGWDEMMRVFRLRISEKLGQGFLPILEGITENFDMPKGREEAQQMVICYSELNRNEKLYEELREWRKAVAFKENRAAYIIATNRILGLISAYIPKTREELKQIPGFGAHRMERYGDAILDITAKYDRTTEFPLNWVAERMDRKQFTMWYYRQKHIRFQKELDEHELRKALLERIEQGATLAIIGEQLELSLREVVQWVEQLDEEGYDLSGLLDRELALMPDKLRETALDAFARLGDQYLKPILQAVYGDELPEGLDLTQTYAWLRILRIHYRRLLEAGVPA